MATYHVENYRTQKSTTIQADSVDKALAQATKLFPTEGATGWLYTPKEGRDGKFDRWVQMAPKPLVLERTGLIVDCFQRYPDLEDFQPPFKEGDKVKWKDTAAPDNINIGTFVRKHVDDTGGAPLLVTRDSDGTEWWCRADTVTHA